MAEPFLPLQGITVLSWEQAVSLPMATRLLADLGAAVVRVESHARSAGRARYAGNDLVRNKLSIGLDFRSEEARAVMRQLVAKADIFCENFTPRVQRQFGLTYADLVKEKPDLIMLSLTGYGQTGDWSERPSYGPGIESAAGHALSIGFPDRPPTRPGTVVYADNVSGFYAVLAILGALHRRQATGKGAVIDLAMYEALAFNLGPSIARSSLSGEPETRRGNGDQGAFIQDVIPAAGYERWLALTVPASKAASLASLLGINNVSPGRLQEALCGWAADRSPEAASEALQAIGIAASPVNNAKDLHLDAQLRSRDAFSLAQHEAPVNGYIAHPHAASPWRVAGRPRVELREAPAVGQDSRAILRDWLGLDEEAIGGLIESGAVGGGPKAPATAIDVRPAAERAAQHLAWKVIAGSDVDSGSVLVLMPRGPHAPGGDSLAPSENIVHGAALQSSPPAPSPSADGEGETGRRGPGGVKVVNLGRTVAGGYAGSMLALAGAEVTRVELVEPPKLPAFEGDDFLRAYVDRGQTVVACDLTSAAGREQLAALVASTDAVIEDFGPDGFESLGLGEAEMRVLNPALVIVRLSEFGQEGPHAGWAGSELVNLAAGGLLFLTGDYERPPVQTAPWGTQLAAGVLAADAALAAIYGGEPVTLDLSKQEDVTSMITPALTEYAYSGTIPARDGMVSMMARIEMASDGWVYAGPGAAASADYVAFSRYLEIPEFAEPRFLTADGRMANWEEHQRLIGPRMLERTRQQWVDGAEEAHLTFGYTQTTSDLLSSEQLLKRDFFAPFGEGKAPSAPFLLDGKRPDALKG